MSVSQARSELPSLLTRVADGEEVTITRHGEAVAVLVRPDVLRARRAAAALAGAADVHELLARAAAGGPGGPVLSRSRADELAAEVRAGRDGT